MIYSSLTCMCFVCSLTTSFPVENEYEGGYYWREFNGVIPQDALPGGINNNGDTTYIGQVFGKKLVIPAKIDVVNSSVSYEWGYEEFFVDENIKILCAKYPQQFLWLSTGNGLLGQLKEKHLIVGGYEEDANIYIGRIQLDNELSLGKVINGSTQATLNTIKDGKGIQHSAFQILSYNPRIPHKDNSDGCQVVVNIF